MSRRTQRPDQEFGSDSFLDVIANIVGILIILIVVVGMKVARQPAIDAARTNASVAAIVDSSASVDLAGKNAAAERLNISRITQERIAAELSGRLNDSQIALEDLQVQESELLARKQAALLREADIGTQRELVTGTLAAAKQQIETDAARIIDLNRQQDAAAERAADLLKEMAIAESELQQTQAAFTGITRAVVSAVDEKRVRDEMLRQTILETQQLKEMLTSLDKQAEPADRLHHRLSPISETADDDQIHFRIANGQISYVPLTELIERLKVQFRSRQAEMMRFTRMDGAVGPVSGYNMKYSVERESTSALEALQYGSGSWTVSVSGWTITPDASLDAEPVELAVRPGSRYRQQVELAAPGSTVTLWIYPDSFRHLPPLREIAHGLQLRVAARPLPDGTPIAGSPGGARSTAQ